MSDHLEVLRRVLAPGDVDLLPLLVLRVVVALVVEVVLLLHLLLGDHDGSLLVECPSPLWC
jgi:hypothetical protein